MWRLASTDFYTPHPSFPVPLEQEVKLSVSLLREPVIPPSPINITWLFQPGWSITASSGVLVLGLKQLPLGSHPSALVDRCFFFKLALLVAAADGKRPTCFCYQGLMQFFPLRCRPGGQFSVPFFCGNPSPGRFSVSPVRSHLPLLPHVHVTWASFPRVSSTFASYSWTIPARHSPSSDGTVIWLRSFSPLFLPFPPLRFFSSDLFSSPKIQLPPRHLSILSAPPTLQRNVS